MGNVSVVIKKITRVRMIDRELPAERRVVVVHDAVGANAHAS